jgi:hypothetical protein
LKPSSPTAQLSRLLKNTHLIWLKGEGLLTAWGNCFFNNLLVSPGGDPAASDQINILLEK